MMEMNFLLPGGAVWCTALWPKVRHDWFFLACRKCAVALEVPMLVGVSIGVCAVEEHEDRSVVIFFFLPFLFVRTQIAMLGAVDCLHFEYIRCSGAGVCSRYFPAFSAAAIPAEEQL
ncbi:hypothetical protein DQ04_20011000 [Trypanosoma grayi]|uniref:hypothetical protein n=1 Tax=Trypanosoma grayi TaxID=71804 RepID=UPI0004F49406|nr:hypothetical protein DQ04_20011000 [Trypanosoma grayi]KEG05613.1 hypothetical protein DQ04_20011000 [Trypanosoma grayi]